MRVQIQVLFVSLLQKYNSCHFKAFQKISLLEHCIEQMYYCIEENSGICLMKKIVNSLSPWLFEGFSLPIIWSIMLHNLSILLKILSFMTYFPLFYFCMQISWGTFFVFIFYSIISVVFCFGLQWPNCAKQFMVKLSLWRIDVSVNFLHPHF